MTGPRDEEEAVAASEFRTRLAEVAQQRDAAHEALEMERRQLAAMAKQRDAATEHLKLALEEIRNCARERDAAWTRAKELEDAAREAQRGRHEAAASLAASQAFCARLADALSTMVLAAHGRD